MSIETLSALERRVQFSVPTSLVAQEVETRLKRLSKSVKMQGFRPGKVPLKVVAQNYGFQVHNEVLTEKINAELHRLIDSAKLRVAGTPSVQAKEAQQENAEAVEFTATFEVYPEVQWGDWKSAQVDRFVLEVADADVDKTIEILRKQRQVYEQVDRPSQLEDRILCDFVGRIDGVEFPGGKAESFEFIVGSQQMLPEFEQAALGVKAGDTKTFSLSFPDDYQGKEVAGKTAEFTLSVKSVSAPKLPALDAEFARQLGIADGDLSKMRDDVRVNLEREVRDRLKSRTKASVFDALLKLAEFEVPKALVAQDVERLKELAISDFKRRGLKTEGFVPPPEIFKEQAERRIKLGLAVADMVGRYQLAPSSEQVKIYVADLSKGYEDPASVTAWYFSDRKRIAEIENAVLEENVVNWVLANVAAQDKHLSFDELMGSPY